VSDLVDTIEMYLRIRYELEEVGIVPLRARIAERLGLSGPTVSQTVSRMERDGLVVETDRHLELTDVGRARATVVMRKHRLAERLLSEVVGLEWKLVHAGAPDRRATEEHADVPGELSVAGVLPGRELQVGPAAGIRWSRSWPTASRTNSAGGPRTRYSSPSSVRAEVERRASRPPSR